MNNLGSISDYYRPRTYIEPRELEPVNSSMGTVFGQAFIDEYPQTGHGIGGGTITSQSFGNNAHASMFVGTVSTGRGIGGSYSSIGGNGSSFQQPRHTESPVEAYYRTHNNRINGNDGFGSDNGYETLSRTNWFYQLIDLAIKHPKIAFAIGITVLIAATILIGAMEAKKFTQTTCVKGEHCVEKTQNNISNPNCRENCTVINNQSK